MSRSAGSNKNSVNVTHINVISHLASYTGHTNACGITKSTINSHRHVAQHRHQANGIITPIGSHNRATGYVAATGTGLREVTRICYQSRRRTRRSLYATARHHSFGVGSCCQALTVIRSRLNKAGDRSLPISPTHGRHGMVQFFTVFCLTKSSPTAHQ